jgi:hypothetical protein
MKEAGLIRTSEDGRMFSLSAYTCGAEIIMDRPLKTFKEENSDYKIREEKNQD